VLVIEATFLDRDSEMARDYGHLTAAKAAALALESNVKQLVLNHISGRYPEEEILAEAAMILPDSRVAADLPFRPLNMGRAILRGSRLQQKEKTCARRSDLPQDRT
jgi:hypothetical protein